MFSLDATEDQLDFETVYGSAKNGWMSDDWLKPTNTIAPLSQANEQAVWNSPSFISRPSRFASKIVFCVF